MDTLDIQVGDIVRLRKQHPCGGWEWEVVRTGADIGLICRRCQRRLLMPRDRFRKSVKALVHRPDTAPSPPDLLNPTTSEGA